MKRENPRDYRPTDGLRYDFTLQQIAYQGENEKVHKPYVTIRAVIDNGPIKGKVLSHRFVMKLDNRIGERQWAQFEEATGVKADRRLQKSACLRPFKERLNDLRFSAIVKVTEYFVYDGEWSELETDVYESRVQTYELVDFDEPELERELKLRKGFPRWKDHI